MPGFKKGPRAVAAAGGNDNHRRYPVDATPSLSQVGPVTRIPPEVLEEFGISRTALLSSHLEDARRELLEGMKVVDTSKYRDLHVRVGLILNAVDDLRSYMATRDGGTDERG